MNRRQRGFRSEELLAGRWQEDLFPDAVANERGRPGLDIRNTGPFAVEVKARGVVSELAELKKLRVKYPDLIPVVVKRWNGQGEASMDYWTVTAFLVDFDALADTFMVAHAE